MTRVEAELFDAQVRSTPLAALLSAGGAALLLVPHANAAAAVWLWVWAAAFLLLGLARTLAAWRWARQPMCIERAEAWRSPWLASTWLHAGKWGLVALLLPHPAGAEAEALLHILLAAIALGGALRLQGFERSMAAHVGLVVGPLLLRDLLLASAFHLAMALLVALIAGYSLLHGRAQSRLLREVAAQRERNEALIAALQRENERVQQAHRAAEAANLERARFFAAANHDLRQPLHAMGLLAQSLDAAPHPPPVREVAQHLGQCVDGMAQVVDALLDITRLDLDPQPAQPRALRLLDPVQEACRPAQALAARKGLDLRIEVAPELAVHSDPALLARLLANLVTNAVRYTPAGFVRVHAQSDGEAVQIAVQDSGIGIAPEHLPRIFEPFFQVDNAARDRHHGLGLGLATVQRLAERLGLTVSVQSTPGQGSCFALRLPRAPAPAAAETAPPPTTAPLAGLRVLLVEDDADARAALARLLGDWGCTVLARRGDEPDLRVPAPEAAPAAAPDAALIDLRLPEGRSGLALLLQLREAFAVPALLLTGDAGAPACEEARRQGVPVAVKPVRPAQLRAFLASLSAAAAAPPSSPAAAAH